MNEEQKNIKDMTLAELEILQMENQIKILETMIEIEKLEISKQVLKE